MDEGQTDQHLPAGEGWGSLAMLGSVTKYSKMADKESLYLRKSERRRDRLQNTVPLLLLAHGDVFLTFCFLFFTF